MLVSALLNYGKSQPARRLFPTVVPEASEFALSNPFAFALASCLDRGTRAEIIWNIPYDLDQRLGHLDPCLLSRLSEDELALLVSEIPRKPRYRNDAPRTIRQLAAIVCEECSGDASRLWLGRSAAQVKQTFRRIHGVGPGIANMVVLLIEKAFGLRFSDLDRASMDIKADVHTMRVLFRLGASTAQTEQAATEAARRLSPGYPGEIDAPLWFLGRDFCYATNPSCAACPLNSHCQRTGVSKAGDASVSV
jgi:endonuclease III